MRRLFGPGPAPGRAVRPLGSGWRSVLAVLAGVLHTAAFAPVDAWWLQLLALAVLACLAATAAPGRAAWLGWWFALGWLSVGLWWLYISMHRYGGLPAPAAALAVLVLAAGLALYYAAALALWARCALGRPWPDALLFGACWLLAELARASWLTGFPWLASGYAHTGGPLAAWAPYIGVYGISALAAAGAAALAGALMSALPGLAPGEAPHRALPASNAKAYLRRPGPRGLAHGWAVAGLAALVALGSWLPQGFTQSHGMLSVSLVQPNVPQDLKFDPERLDANLAQLRAAVQAAPGALVVTPESVVPLPFEQLAPDYWLALQAAVAAPGRAALIGVFLPDGQGNYVNSMVGLAADSPPEPGRFYQYGKRHLLPFGEFIPPGFHWFVRAMAIPLDDQAAGTRTAPFAAAGQRLRPLICYEDLFGEDIADSVLGPQAATVFVNASNLAWFGRHMVQDQHLQFSRMRALELQRPVVRATNTGATAVVNHLGQVTARLPPEVAGTLNAELEGRVGATPYARWLAAAGLWPLWALGLATVVWAWAWARVLARRSGPGAGL